ncbi:MAG: hypothetical protein PHG83_00015 [Patescibacteria group bacterium]|nr:hypothetical protein [Patescibacteria group bacterium]
MKKTCWTIIICLIVGFIGFKEKTHKTREILRHSLISRIDAAEKMLSNDKFQCSNSTAYIALWDTLKQRKIDIVKVRIVLADSNRKILTPEDNNMIPIITLRGLNASFLNPSPLNYQLLSIKSKKCVGDKIVDLVWTPFSKGILSAELENTGREYLKNLIAQAYEQLKNQGVRSQAQKKKLVAEMISSRIPTLLFLTENAHFGSTKRTLAFLGANREKSFVSVKSKRNAFGPAQMTSPTYQLLRKKYPAANLPVDFFAGVLDHKVAIKSMILLCDWNMRYLDNVPRSEQERELVALYHSGVEIEKLGLIGQGYLAKCDSIRINLVANNL